MMYTGMASTEAASWFARKSVVNWYLVVVVVVVVVVCCKQVEEE